MPRELEQGTVAPVAVETGGGPPPPPDTPPQNPFAPFASPGLRGKARFAEIMRQMPGFFDGPVALRNWVNTIPLDPSDPDYNAEVLKLREQVLVDDPLDDTQAKLVNIRQGWVDPLKPGPASMSASGQATKPALPNLGTVVDPLKPGPSGQSASGDTTKPAVPTAPDGRTLKNEEGKDKELLTQAKFNFEQPTFRGRPVGTDELYQNGALGDPYLDGFLSENGITLPGGAANKATRSGKYVLMGYETSPEHGGRKPIYMYVDDAAAAGQRVESTVLSQYQKELGLPVTGLMEGWLKQQWDRAVAQASDSAVTGLRITVREWFDIFVQSAIAQKKAGGSGGGGGRQPMEEFDYYRAMMAVLGDISGVEG